MLQNKLNKVAKIHWQSILLASVFFVLSFKGSNIIDIGDGVQFAIAMPNWLAMIKQYVHAIALILIGLFIVSSFKLRKNIKYSIPLVVYLAVITYYYAISAFLGEQIESIIAICIVQAIILAFLKYQDASIWSIKFPKWLIALNAFSALFVISNLILFLFGYGYPDIGNIRYFGSTFHPNTMGAISAIAFGIFVAQAATVEMSKILKGLLLIFLFSAGFLVVISGSRGSILMMGVSLLAFSQSAKSFIYTSIALGFFYLIVTSLGDSNGLAYSALDRAINTKTSNREEVWQLLFNDFEMNPLFGVGNKTAVSGSIYLTALAGTGLFGGMAFIGVCLLTAKRAFSCIATRITNEIGLSRFVSSIIVLQLLAAGFFEASIFDRLSPVSIIMLCSVAVVNMKVLRRES